VARAPARVRARPPRRILVFARAPQPGRCKTRLIPRLGACGAARLQRQLARRTLDVALATGAAVELWCEPGPGHAFFVDSRRRGVRLRRQPPGDLGRRMALALAHAARGGACAVLVGTDCPTLDARDLVRAFAALDAHDAVLQPSRDGGYVLIGARDGLPRRALAGIAWSSGRELAQTRARLARAGLSWWELPPRADLDTPRDWRAARRAGVIPS
jgi:rSAM/selenodomain-associated transferase 1